jgi:cellulose synthase/poly-beta-1,6-N-acetylglucosamine synthase-like glycosyltransferase
MFWYVLMLELPRYGLSILTLMISAPSRLRSLDRGKRRVSHIYDFAPRVSVIVAGLNEAEAIEKCVLSLRAQSFKDLEIVIVSDGSTDRMPQIARDLVRWGLADKAFSSDLRCGKSSGVNLAFRFSSGDIVINVDCDCSYDRFAIERIVAAFDDSSVGAACGDIVPRNGGASVIAAFQVIEYISNI